MKISKIILYSILAITCNNQQKMDNKDLKKSEGIWQFNEIVPDTDNQVTSSGLTDQYTFFISDGLITISLFSDQLTNWKSEDDVYILKTKWENNTLFYLPPAGDWTSLADFNGEIFYMSDGKQKRIFRKILKEKVVKWNEAILKPGRIAFDYNTHN